MTVNLKKYKADIPEIVSNSKISKPKPAAEEQSFNLTTFGLK